MPACRREFQDAASRREPRAAARHSRPARRAAIPRAPLRPDTNWRTAMRYGAPLLLAAATLAGCTDTPAAPDARDVLPAAARVGRGEPADRARAVVGGVFTLTNDSTGNAVVGYE